MVVETDTRMRILIADDDELVRETLTFLLDEHGYRVTAVANGREALERIAAVHPDLIILDFLMPGINGLQVYRCLRCDPAVRDIPVIFLSGQVSIRQEIRKMQEARILFIEKPCGAVELFEHVDGIIGKR